MIYLSILICAPSSDFRGTDHQAGEGIEREVIFLAYQLHTENPSRFFQPRENGFYALRTITGNLANESRNAHLRVLGALSALCMTYKYAPARDDSGRPMSLDPLWYLFIFNNYNLDSLQPETVKEWHPDFGMLIEQFVRSGPSWDTTPLTGLLATYFDYEVTFCCFNYKSMH